MNIIEVIFYHQVFYSSFDCYLDLFPGKPVLFMKKFRNTKNPAQWHQVERVTRRKINPYDITKVSSGYRRYRTHKRELFADWFSGVITDKGNVKRESRSYYNRFKKENKPFFKKLKEEDLRTLKPYMKIPRGHKLFGRS